MTWDWDDVRARLAAPPDPTEKSTADRCVGRFREVLAEYPDKGRVMGFSVEREVVVDEAGRKNPGRTILITMTMAVEVRDL